MSGASAGADTASDSHAWADDVPLPHQERQRPIAVVHASFEAEAVARASLSLNALPSTSDSCSTRGRARGATGPERPATRAAAARSTASGRAAGTPPAPGRTARGWAARAGAEFTIDASSTTTNCATASSASASQRRGSRAATTEVADSGCGWVEDAADGDWGWVEEAADGDCGLVEDARTAIVAGLRTRSSDSSR
jgi:hypothetical protein